MQPPRRLGHRARHRRVDGERVRHLVDGEAAGHRQRDRVDELARLRRDDHTTGDDAGARPAEQLDEARRGRPASWPGRCRPGRASHSAPRTVAASTSRWVQPTVAISGAVKTVDDTWARSSGVTASPSACHIAIRPCMAATDASMSTPVQSPAAYTPRADVRETPSTSTNPRSSTPTPDSSRPEPVGVGHRPEGEQAVRAVDRAAVGERDPHRRRPDAAPPRPSASARQHRHAPAAVRRPRSPGRRRRPRRAAPGRGWRRAPPRSRAPGRRRRTRAR